MPEALPERVCPNAATVRVDKTCAGTLGSESDKKRLRSVEVQNWVSLQHASRAPYDSWVECPTLTEFEDRCAGLSDAFAVIAGLASDNDVRLPPSSTLFPDELVHRALGATALERPEDMKDGLHLCDFGARPWSRMRL